MENTKNSLPEKIRVQSIGLIQEMLAESIDLNIQVKQAHWNVKGPDFISLHLLFDQIAAQTSEYSDLIAERIVQLGGVAEGTLQMTAKRTKLSAYSPASLSGKEHILAVVHALAQYGEAARRVIRQANEISDVVTADVFTQILRGVDKNLWLVEAHLRSEK